MNTHLNKTKIHLLKKVGLKIRKVKLVSKNNLNIKAI